VSDVTRALSKDAPQLWPEAAGNIALDWEEGDAAAVDAAFARAAHVERVRLLDTRLAPSAMEPRAALATYEPESQRYTLIAPTQGVAVVRKILTEAVFKVPAEKIRVLTHDVGGGFGMKVQTYPEYAALLYAARRVARPVKWTATRLESFLADTHGRDGVLEGELALDADGRFLALRARTYVGIGAYTTTYVAIITTWNTKNCLSSVYKFPAIYFNTNVVLTNAAPMGPYRGAGRPEALYLIESLIDRAARANAASTAAASPSSQSRAMLPGASGQSCGASLDNARVTSDTAGSWLYATATASAASRAWARLSATTRATGSPT
jgi:carbon-monoxide dehydrogenase large subunit